jgi:hypothetical protein
LPFSLNVTSQTAPIASLLREEFASGAFQPAGELIEGLQRHVPLRHFQAMQDGRADRHYETLGKNTPPHWVLHGPARIDPGQHPCPGMG